MNVPAPPEKGKGASPAPIPNPFNSPQNNSSSAIAQQPNCFGLLDPIPLVCGAQTWCEHTDTRIAIEPPGSVHFAREVCCNCDRVLRWLPKPETLERQRYNALRLVKLAMHSGLSVLERAFVRDVAQLRKLSPKQMAIIDRLCAQYLNAAK